MQLRIGLLGVVVLVANLAGGIYLAASHGYHVFRPIPAPKAVVSGVYWAGAPSPIRANPDDPPRPIGMVRLDASGSTSARPIRWKLHGPKAGPIRIYSPDGLLGGSIAEIDIYEPGTYHFHGTASEPGGYQTDTGSVSFAVRVPEPPAPPGPAPKPEPIPPPRPDVPVPPADPFASLGQSYRSMLGSIYANAFDAGAKMLEAGQPFSMALKQVGLEWAASRTANYDRLLAPEWSKILPESTPDDKVTADQRSAMAKAWRSFATGLRSR